MTININRIRIMALLLGCLFTAMVQADDTASRYQWGKHSDEQIQPGDIVLESPNEGIKKVAKILGAPLGNEVVDGLDVGIYVMQASNPEVRKPGGQGPTHLFNVSLKPEDGGKLVTEALGSVVIERDGVVQRWPTRLVNSHHQARGRLEETGHYQVSFEYVLGGGKKGKTAGVPFEYTGEGTSFHVHHGSHKSMTEVDEHGEHAGHEMKH